MLIFMLALIELLHINYLDLIKHIIFKRIRKLNGG